MKDVLLLTAIAMVEADEPIEIDVTLVVGGFLISGFIVSLKTYFAHHPVSSEVHKVVERVEAEQITTEKGQVEPGTRNFIHLRDAKYYTPGQKPIPSNTGVYCRVQLESVLAFSFGKLTTDISA